MKLATFEDIIYLIILSKGLFKYYVGLSIITTYSQFCWKSCLNYKIFDILSSQKLNIFSIRIQLFSLVFNCLMLPLCSRNKRVESHCIVSEDKRVVIPSSTVQRDTHLVCPELINNNTILPRTSWDRFDLPVNCLPDRSRLDDASDMLDHIGWIVH